MEIIKDLFYNFQIEAERENHTRLVNLLCSLSYSHKNTEMLEVKEVKDLILVKCTLIKLNKESKFM